MLPTSILFTLLAAVPSPAATPSAAAATPAAPASVGRHFALRFHPGQDLQKEILAFAKAQNLRAAAIVTCVGSLKTATVRFANQPMPGSSVFTTAEIVLVELDALSFSREKDSETTYDELVVRPRK